VYTVKQLSSLAGITVRTLHHYDEVGLLKPSSVGGNGYRYYTEQELFRLQQILFFRELGLDLKLIRQVLDQPDFERISALQKHRQALQEKISRIRTLINTVDSTIMHLTGGMKMNPIKIFEGFTPEEEKKYEQEAIIRWGDTARQSIKLWKNYSEQKKKDILQESGHIYTDIVANMANGPASPQVQALLVKWHQHLRYFYEPTPDILQGLGEMYDDDPAFHANLAAIHQDLPAFLKKSIRIYVTRLRNQQTE
jgi:MerR family transcriptional regulator, thiopeptide resistance regulator